MSHFTAAKTQCNLGLVTVLQKPNQIAQLDLIVAFISSRPKLHLFNLSLFLLFLLQSYFLLYIKDMLAVIHDLTDWRLGIRRYLYQIQCLFLRCFHSLSQWHYANLRAIRGNQSNFGGGDIFVKTRPLAVFFNKLYSARSIQYARACRPLMKTGRKPRLEAGYRGRFHLWFEPPQCVILSLCHRLQAGREPVASNDRGF